MNPVVRLQSSHMQICTTIGFQGSMAFFATHMNLTERRSEIPPDLNIFPLLLGGKPLTMEVSLLRHGKQPINRFSRYFLSLLMDRCDAVEKTPIARLAAAPPS